MIGSSKRPGDAAADRSERCAATWRSSRLARLPASYADELLPEAREREVAAGETIRWDEPILAVVMAGQVGIFMASGSRRIAMRYLGPGDMLGLPTVVAPNIRYSGVELQVRALEESTLMMLPAERFRALAQADRHVAWMIGEWLVEDMVGGHIVLMDDIFLPVRRLLARHLLDLAHREGGDLVVRATQDELADVVGSVRVVVARALSELRDEGLIARGPSGLVLRDPTRLHEAAHGRRPARGMSQK